KSTFVNFVAACMAGELLHESTVNLAQLTAPLPTDDDTEPQPQPWEHGALLPVTVTLRELAAGWLPDAHHPATEKQFWQYVTAQLNQPEYAKFLRHELRTHGGLLLFDGLDEVPTAERHRDHIKQLVEDVATVFPKCRILITSRTYAYQKEDWKLAGFSEAELTPFTPSQINRFIERWYEHVAAVSQDINTETATGRATLLKQAIDRSQRLQEFAQQPLLLTLMATLHAFRGGSLPDKRVELYEEAVQLLLDRWEKQRAQTNEQGEIVQGGRSLHEWLRVDQAAVFNLLCRLAFEVHSTQTDLQRTADILERDLVMGLYNLGKEQGQAINQQEIINYISQRAGLLIAHANGVYTFPHRTFQEYLASVHLTEDEYPYKMAELVRRDPNRWREVTLLAGGKAGSGATAAVWLLVDALCAEPDTEVGEELTEMLWGALLAGQLITETIDLKKPLHRAQERHLKRTKTLLIEAMTSEEMPILERALAGRLLSQLGDPREGVGVTEEGLPDIVWGEEVPAGTYTIGGDSDASRSFDEQQITIEEPYQLSRYPITYSQFQCFVEADDYDDPRWWGGMPERGKDWLDTEHVTKEVSEQRFRFLNHPRENVTWYQAVAFCRWLSDKLDLDVTLPHEYQWEVAARYPNGQKYPWGDEFVETLANTHESSLNMTTAVGMYPQGRNEKLDLYDLSGNVWEWCINKWNVPEDSTVDESSASRVLRGGSWSGNQDYARVALRNDDGPYDRDLNFGFRVCCVCPPSRPLSTGPSGER
ncbi:MAG: SUMF1/EgtB/PvdO family nonheme iron enzyme, partial [Anaerolineales bacterium]|nr:SUMF1/EgtB/PvdO family nonheme iron enzyme [Anaerolineales bacterium]